MQNLKTKHQMRNQQHVQVYIDNIEKEIDTVWKEMCVYVWLCEVRRI